MWLNESTYSVPVKKSTCCYSCVPFQPSSVEQNRNCHSVSTTSPPGKKESLYLTERGREAFDRLYRLWEGEMRVVSTATPSPVLPLPLDSQTQLVSDLLNVLIGVASTTFPLNQVHFITNIYQPLKCNKTQLICCFRAVSD